MLTLSSIIKKLFHITFKTLGCFFMLLGFLLFVTILGAGFTISSLKNDIVSLVKSPDEPYVLSIDLDADYPEKPYYNFFSIIEQSDYSLPLSDTIATINKAATDDKVSGLYARLNSLSLGAAGAEELRVSLENFKKTGKPMILFSETLGTDGNGTLEYYLASAFTDIYVQPSGEVNLTGFSLQTTFFKDMLNKIGIKPEFYARHEYKNFGESYTRMSLSKYAKETENNLLASLSDIVIKDISSSINIPTDDIMTLINKAPLSATQSKEKGLIKDTLYLDEIPTILPTKSLITLAQYSKIGTDKLPPKGKIAVIYIDGMIVSGTSDSSPFSSPEYLSASDDIVNAVLAAGEDKQVKAVIVRINSAGGSYTASDSIRHSLENIKKSRNIPIIASMGDVAASGGYMVALAADKIIANKMTITGSIGVFGGKPVISELLKKIGIAIDTTQIGQNADMMSITKSFTTTQQKKFEQTLDNIYQDFITKVSESRNIPIKELDKLARGRVFTGQEAKNNGLIDEVGGFTEAVSLAVDMIGDGMPENYQIVTYPSPKNELEQLLELLQIQTLGLSPLSLYNSLTRNFAKLSQSTILFAPLPSVK